MKAKKIGGLVAMAVGALVIVIAIYAKMRVGAIQNEIQGGSNLFGNNPVNKQITGALEGQVGAYNAPITWTLIGGIVLLVAGGCLYYFNSRRR